ncbi:MAG TPA: ABC transporter ATP-binding protein, partial [Anaerolineae bacterium]|nr:ABC transporter ATP-binding protein [Anaerolineae bacterium]
MLVGCANHPHPISSGLFVIEVQNVSKHYFNVTALNDVSLKIEQGAVTALLGPNGAGKSTLFRIIAGILNADAGRVRPIRERWPTVAYKPDRLAFPNHLKVYDYLVMVGKLSNLGSAEIRRQVDSALDRVNLNAAAAKKISALSKGMRQRLGLAQVLIGNPSLLLLDEPTNGLDPTGQAEIQHLIRQLQAEGKTVLVSSHQLHEITTMCTQIVIIDHGKIRYTSSMGEALAVRPKVTIQTDRDLTPIAAWIGHLHPDISFSGNNLIIGEAAIGTRRQVLTLLL